MKLKVIKKNQLAVLVISLMLITAGYLNYDTTYNKGNSQEASTNIEENIGLAALGDAELVNTDVTENVENKEQENQEKQEENKEEQASIEPKEEMKQLGSNDYFTASKLERNVMYSQMIERYQEIIVSNTQAVEQKAVATQEINKINEIQNAIMIAENLLTSKNFEKNIIFVNGNSVNVIIGKEKLETEEVAQIQNIVSRELKVELENIHISMK